MLLCVLGIRTLLLSADAGFYRHHEADLACCGTEDLCPALRAPSNAPQENLLVIFTLTRRLLSRTDSNTLCGRVEGVRGKRGVRKGGQHPLYARSFLREYATK